MVGGLSKWYKYACSGRLVIALPLLFFALTIGKGVFVVGGGSESYKCTCADGDIVETGGDAFACEVGK